jgi:hypothetical protein
MPERPVRPPRPSHEGHDRWSGHRGAASGPSRGERWAEPEPSSYRAGVRWDGAEEGGWDRDFGSAAGYGDRPERYDDGAERYGERDEWASARRGGEDHVEFRGQQAFEREDAWVESGNESAGFRGQQNTAPRSLSSRLGPLTAASGVINMVRRRPSFDDLVPQDERPGGPRPPRGSASFRQPKRRDRGPLTFVAAAVALLLVVGGVVFAFQRGGDDPAVSNQASISSPEQPDNPAGDVEASATKAAEKPKKDKKAEKAKKAAQGSTGAGTRVKRAVFRGTSPSQVAEFSKWLGRDIQYVVDYPPRATWNDIADPAKTLSVWRNTDYRMVYAIGMLPGYKSDPSTLAAGAKGDYNHYFTTLAKTLVAYDQGDAILRLGWEANVDGYKWHPEGAQGTKNFKKYWREIVTTMRAVPGAEKLEFDWNVNNGGETYDSTLFYPGNKYVDYIGVDVYDISWAQDSYPYPADCNASCRRGRQEAAWMNVMDANFGLNFWSNFAEAQGKPISLPEWGVWGDRADQQGGDDNPYFIEQMYEFISDPANNVAYQSYFEYDVGDKGDHRLSQHEKAGKKYVKLFGK